MDIIITHHGYNNSTPWITYIIAPGGGGVCFASHDEILFAKCVALQLKCKVAVVVVLLLMFCKCVAI